MTFYNGDLVCKQYGTSGVHRRGRVVDVYRSEWTGFENVSVQWFDAPVGSKPVVEIAEALIKVER